MSINETRISRSQSLSTPISNTDTQTSQSNESRPKTDTIQLTPVTPPSTEEATTAKYLGNGRFEYNNVTYKVTLYKGSEDLDPKANLEEWKKIATKIIDSLKKTNLLPTVKGEVIDVNYSEKTVSKKAVNESDYVKQDIPNFDQDFSNYSSEDTENETMLNKLETYFNLNEAYKLNLQKKDPNHVPLKETRGSFNQNTDTTENKSKMNLNINIINPGSAACTAIATHAAIAMLQNESFTKEKINETVLERIKTYQEIEPTPENQASPKLHLDFQRVNDELNLHNTSTKFRYNSGGFKGNQASTEELNQKQQEDLKELFKAKLLDLLKSIIEGQNDTKISGVFILQGVSYAMSIENNNQTITKIEFFDSHGRNTSQGKTNAYYKAFIGDNTVNNFITFFTDELKHSYQPYTPLLNDPTTTDGMNQQEIDDFLETQKDQIREQNINNYSMQFEAITSPSPSPYIGDETKSNISEESSQPALSRSSSTTSEDKVQGTFVFHPDQQQQPTQAPTSNIDSQYDSDSDSEESF
jgi:hypothetical protein